MACVIFVSTELIRRTRFALFAVENAVWFTLGAFVQFDVDPLATN